jgi:arginine/ornithine N-succinyltransferase beta subunit
MVRRTSPAKKTDDYTFAVRCRVEIPESGMRNLPDVRQWLDERVTRRGYALHSTNPPGEAQGMFIFANDPAAVAECVLVFGMTVMGWEKQTP